MAPGNPSRPQSASITSTASSSRHSTAPPPYAKYSITLYDDPTTQSGYSNATTLSSMPPPTRSRRRSDAKRSVSLSDRQLADVAATSQRAVRWADILDASEHNRAQWKRIDDAGGFSIYSKKDANRFAVLAVGVLSCSVPEVARLLHSPDAEKYLVNMEALYGNDFKDGAFVHRVNLRRLRGEGAALDDELQDVTVKSAIFDKSGWLQQHDKWSFVEATYRRNNGSCFETRATTMSPKDVTVPLSRMSSTFARSDSRGRGSKHFHDITTSFSVQPEEPETDVGAVSSGSDISRPWKETRVYFYGEFSPPTQNGFSIATLSRPADKAIKHRLVAMARSCDRLTALVRRRRLGVQVLVDRSILSVFASPSKRCVCCNKSIRLLAVKQCRVCGQGVCTECSHKHERESKVRGSQRMLLEDIRVCDRCIDRVDRSDFSELNDASLLGPVVHPNKPNDPPASAVLRDLLKSELLLADSDKRKVSVMNVIKCVIDPDDTSSSSSAAPSPAMSTRSSRRSGGIVLLPTTKSKYLHEDDFVQALDSLKVKQVPYNEAELSSATGRSYVVDSSNPDQQMAFPLPETEAERLRAMEAVHVQELINNSDELNIICELAAKEMDTFASMVTIVTPDEQQVVASNLEALQNAKFPRAEAFCSHTIMDERPLLIPHPEADVRFHQCAPVKELGIRYYCGFPIKSEDDTVIGALCCINKSSRDMNETQFNAMQKLARTAAKVIHVQGKQRNRTMSTMSTASKG